MNSNISIEVNLNIDEICSRTDVVKLFKEDVEKNLYGAESSYIGIGYAAGVNKVKKATRMAIRNPIMRMPMSEAIKVLIIITASVDFDGDDFVIISALIKEAAHPDASLLFGLSLNEEMEDEIRVDVIATK